MKNTFRITLIISFSILSSSLFAQQSLQATIGLINKSTPKIGFNANGQFPSDTANIGANWTQQAFRDSTVLLNPQVLRYPGGTLSNHWDWQTGWYKPGYQPPFTPLMIRPEEFKVGLDAVSQGEGLYVINLETSSPNYEMDGIRHMNSLGLSTLMIELGNEHNLQNGNYPNQLMTSLFYAQTAKTYYDSIKAYDSQIKVCVVGSNNNLRPDWHQEILLANPNIEAFAWHPYLSANNVDLVFYVNRAFAEVFGSANKSGSLEHRFSTVGEFNLLPTNKEVWVTEYNLLENSPLIAETWTHALFLSAMHHLFLTKANITMFLNHSLASNDSWHESISKKDNHITANGVAMKLLLDVSKGSQTCQDITFSGNTTMSYLTTTIPKLIGWKFNHTGAEKGFICNLSSDTFKISLATVFNQAMQYDQYSADTTFVVNGITSLNKLSGNTTDSITIYPYSFTQITSNITTGITNNSAKNNTGLKLFPNPVKEKLTITSENDFDNAEVVIYNILGIEVMKESKLMGSEIIFNTSNFAQGAYFLKIINRNETETIKFIKE